MQATKMSPARGWVIVFVLASSGLISSLQFTLAVPILPELPNVLDISVSNAAWVVIATLLSSTISTPILSRMADLYGRKRMMLVSLALLFVGSVIAAVGMTFFTIIIGRVLQGVATAVVPIGISLIHAHVSQKQANIGVATLSGSIGFGSALGMPLSGWLMTHYGLASIFWVSAVASGVFFLAMLLLVPEAKIRLHRKFAVVNTLLLIVWLTAMMLLISKGGEWGWLAPMTVGVAAVMVLVAGVWIKSSLTNPNSIIDIKLSVTPAMVRINLASFLVTFAMFAYNLLTIQQAMAPKSGGVGLGLPVVEAGFSLLPYALAMTIATPLTGWVITRFGAKQTLILGAVLMAIGFVMRAAMPPNMTSIIISGLATGVGISLAFSAMPALVSASSPADMVASANGVNALVRSLSGAVATSVYAFVVVMFADPINPQFLSGPGFIASFVVSALLCVIAAALAWAIPKQRERRN